MRVPPPQSLRVPPPQSLRFGSWQDGEPAQGAPHLGPRLVACEGAEGGIDIIGVQAGLERKDGVPPACPQSAVTYALRRKPVLPACWQLGKAEENLEDADRKQHAHPRMWSFCTARSGYLAWGNMDKPRTNPEAMLPPPLPVRSSTSEVAPCARTVAARGLSRCRLKATACVCLELRALVRVP